MSWLKCHYKDILIDYIQFINEESPLSFPSSDEWLHFSEKNRVATLQSYHWSDALVFAIASGKSVQYPSQGKSSKRSELQENYETMMEQLCKLANKFWKFYDQITIVSQLHRRSKTLKWLENYLLLQVVHPSHSREQISSMPRGNFFKCATNVHYDSVMIWSECGGHRLLWPQKHIIGDNAIIHSIMTVK